MLKKIKFIILPVIMGMSLVGCTSIEKEFKTFKNLIEDYEIRMYKYGFDTQKTLTLYFDLNKKKGKFVTLEIYLYSNSVVYEWE